MFPLLNYFILLISVFTKGTRVIKKCSPACIILKQWGTNWVPQLKTCINWVTGSVPERKALNELQIIPVGKKVRIKRGECTGMRKREKRWTDNLRIIAVNFMTKWGICIHNGTTNSDKNHTGSTIVNVGEILLLIWRRFRNENLQLLIILLPNLLFLFLLAQHCNLRLKFFH